MTPTVTLNWGLRYDYEAPRTDRFNQLSNFDYTAASPLKAAGIDLRGGLIFPGVNGLSRFQVNPDRNNFAPRIGIAWRISPKTVLRTGADISTRPPQDSAQEQVHLASAGIRPRPVSSRALTA